VAHRHEQLSQVGDNEMNKVALRVVLLGLVAGGLCGAAVGLGYAPPFAGVAGAIVVAIAVGALVARAKKRASAK
jgi:outer membrane lipoprotein SlyB